MAVSPDPPGNRTQSPGPKVSYSELESAFRLVVAEINHLLEADEAVRTLEAEIGRYREALHAATEFIRHSPPNRQGRQLLLDHLDDLLGIRPIGETRG
jgi:hypothetical protein